MAFRKSLKLSDLSKYKLREPKQDRCIYSSLSKVVDDLFDVSGQVFVLRRSDDEIALSVDPEIVLAPIIDAVCFDRLFDY